VRVETTDGSKVEYAYDPLGRRIRKSAPSRTVDYVWDRDFLVFERVRPRAPSGAAARDVAAVREFVFRSDSLVPIAVREQQRTLLIETDQIGLPRIAFDREGHVEWEGDFGGFGEQVRAGAGGTVPFRFPGQLADEETGLYYNRFRYYDPELRIYTQPDPLGLAGGEHPHNYVPDPTHWTDPLGLTDLDDPGHSVYLLEKKNPATGQWEPYYTGISNDPTRRLDEHIDDGRVTQAGIDDDELRMRTVESDLTYAEARGYEQAYMDHHGTRTASPGDTVGVGTGNKVNSFDTSRTDPRGKAFEKHRKSKAKALAACP
jgi:RHS repeat-associated protein